MTGDSTPPADDERVPPLTAQQLGLCGPRSDDPGVGPDAARHTPPTDDRGRKISAAEARRIADEVLRENEQRRHPPAEDQATSGESRDDSIWALTEELEECRAHLESARACWHGWLGVASSVSARLAAVRALADYLETEARAGRVAPQLHAVGALIRARLDGPAEAPAPEPVDDQVTAWIKAARDRQNPDGTPWDLGRWNVLDDLLDDYRLHRVTGTPLDQHACEGGHCCADEGAPGPVSVGPAKAVSESPKHSDTALAGYQRIADAIERLCEESAEPRLRLHFRGEGGGVADPYFRLAQILDRAGLIDWAAFRAGLAEASVPARSPIEVAERAMFARRDAARLNAPGVHDLDDVLRETSIDLAKAGVTEPAQVVAAARRMLVAWTVGGDVDTAAEELEAVLAKAAEPARVPACGDIMSWAGYTNVCDLPAGHQGSHQMGETTRWSRDRAIRQAVDRARAGNVTTTPAAPGYPRIADAITAACEAADIDLTVVHDGRVLDYVPGVRWLATVLDKAGLIDWSAFQDETPAEPALIGTYADPANVAHQDHKHAVDDCGYCPSEEDR